MEQVILDSIWKDLEEQLYKPENVKEDCFVKCFCEDIRDQKIIYLECEAVCGNCGLILEDNRISDEAEWRCFNNENGFSDTGNRCGVEIDTLTPIYSMSTIIGGNSKMAKRHLWNSLPYHERVLYQLKNELNIIVSLHNLPSILIRSTLLLYKKFINKEDLEQDNINSYRGNNKNTIVSVCFYYAAKYHNINLTSVFICDIFNIKTQKFSKYCKLYNECIHNCDNSINSVSNLCERYTNKLNLSFNIQKLCKNIIKCCELMNFMVEMSPQSVISGVIYFVNCEMKLELSKKDIIDKCDISENTIMKTYKFLVKHKQEIFNIIKNFK
jgi:transcription initiation factor TFIIIB Brf1 subunit/transcription initiation factor TFIIB